MSWSSVLRFSLGPLQLGPPFLGPLVMECKVTLTMIYRVLLEGLLRLEREIVWQTDSRTHSSHHLDPELDHANQSRPTVPAPGIHRVSFKWLSAGQGVAVVLGPGSGVVVVLGPMHTDQHET